MAEYPTPEDVRDFFQGVADRVTITSVFDLLQQASHEASMQWFPDTADDLLHHTLAMCGEVGEVANIVKKLHRGSMEPSEAAPLLRGELADVFIYLLNCAAICKVNLGEAYLEKQKFNQERF